MSFFSRLLKPSVWHRVDPTMVSGSQAMIVARLAELHDIDPDLYQFAKELMYGMSLQDETFAAKLKTDDELGKRFNMLIDAMLQGDPDKAVGDLIKNTLTIRPHLLQRYTAYIANCSIEDGMVIHY